MNEELDSLRELARAFCERELAPHRSQWALQQHVDRKLWTKAGELGLLCMSIPQEYGGGGGSFAHEVVLLEEQARANDSAWGHSVHSAIVAHYVLNCGTPEQKRLWLPRLARGELVGSIAITEPGAGSDLQAIRTRAIRDGDEYVINGSKTFISNGFLTDLAVVAVKTDPDQGAYGVSLILVEARSEGFRRGRPMDKVGLKGHDICELFFDDLRVPADHLLGREEGQGAVQLMQLLLQERLVIAVTSVAAMETAVAQTVRYAKERVAFGGTLFDFQNTRFTLAECATEARVCRAFLDRCINSHLRGDLDVPTAAMAKWWCSDRASRVVDACMQLYGGYGYMNEFQIAQNWTDVRAQRIYGGANEVMKEIIGHML